MTPERLAELKRMAYDRMVTRYHQRGLPTTGLRQVPVIGCGDEFSRCGELGCEAVALELIAEIERLQEENRALHEECLEYRYGADL
ncbi:MAG: hypothetical protein Q7L55_06055 [Actinomycetota bacterium]|nr:hypothetical protein [Actinomycetota bacterium]